jgi:hypothetical protein
MRTIILLLFSFFISVIGKSQVIENVQGISMLGQTKFVSMLSDHSIWWSSEGSSWEKVPVKGLPADKKIKLIDVYVKFSLSKKNARLVAVLDDNTMWWCLEGESWEKISGAGLPANANIKFFKPYVKGSSMGSMDTRFIAVLDNNTMWWYSLGDPWKEVSAKGLPDNYVVTGIGTYQKMGMMGTETRYVITLADNTVWWYADGKKWQQLENEGLPANAKFKNFTVYLKINEAAIVLNPALGWEGRLVGVLDDESIWWFAASGKTWRKMETNGLPKQYKIKSLEVYQKYPGLSGETRVIVLLEDNSIWWWVESKGWTKFSTTGLPVTN